MEPESVVALVWLKLMTPAPLPNAIVPAESVPAEPPLVPKFRVPTDPACDAIVTGPAPPPTETVPVPLIVNVPVPL